jgi:uncharacterized RDD family membrane protein YckC
MTKWFYTAADATQQGPVDEPTLLGLNETGMVQARTLVWHAGLPEWRSFLDVAPALFAADDGTPTPLGVCAYSGRVYPEAEMLPYGSALIGPEVKEPFLQRLMESSVVAVADATERSMSYVGFWWRSLAATLDYLIKMAPAWLGMIPFYVVMMVGGTEVDQSNPTGWSIAMAVAYGFGLLFVMAFSIFYETWMVGKYQSTLGKMIIGAKVVNPDGTRLTYKRAFIRWLVKKPLVYSIVFIPSTVGFGLVVAGIGAAANNSEGGATFVLAMMTGLVVYAALLALFSGVYWMCAFDPERRTFHDRISATRVVRK